VRVFVDGCVGLRPAPPIAGHDVRTACDQGWTGISNGRLLALVAGDFGVFVTVDRNLSYQQNLRALRFAVIVLLARTNRLADLQPLVPQLLTAIATAPVGAATIVGAG
jgi:hypothetical protein